MYTYAHYRWWGTFGDDFQSSLNSSPTMSFSLCDPKTIAFPMENKSCLDFGPILEISIQSSLMSHHPSGSQKEVGSGKLLSRGQWNSSAAISGRATFQKERSWPWLK